MDREFLDRLIKHLNFIEEELKDYAQFKILTREEYLKNKDKRVLQVLKEAPSRTGDKGPKF